MSEADFTRPTTGFWQVIEPAGGNPAFPDRPPYRYGYPARLPDGRFLVLPVRRVRGQGRAVASLIANQASFEVVRTLSGMMAECARRFGAEVVVGLPTLGFAFAPLVAEALGFARFVPMGYSRKLWYDEALSVPVNSLTTPDQIKRLYLDPNQKSLVEGRDVLIVDDAVSTGGTLLAGVGARVAGVVVAMRQGRAWRERLGADLAARVAGVFDSPRLVLEPDGWWPEDDSP